MGFRISTPMLVHYAPDLFAVPNDPHAIMLVAASRGVDRALVDRNPLDISPVSDDRPFFFQFLDLRRWSTTGGETIYARGLRTYTTDSIAIAVVALLMVLAPLRKRASDGPDESSGDSRAFSPREAVWAVTLGSAYLGVELVLIQRATLYLGLRSCRQRAS